MSQKLKRERRCKILWVSDEFLLHTLLDWRPSSQTQRYYFEGLPPGWQLESVAYSFERMAFGLLVTHESFEPTPEGDEFPSLHVECCPTPQDVISEPRQPIRFREFL